MPELKLDIIPDEEDPGAFVFVDGFIGEHKYRFLLDTGAASSEITFDSYTSTFNSIGSKKSSGAFSSDTLDLIQVPYIKIGPIKKENFILRRQVKDTKRQHNLIGMDILKDYCCHFMFNSEIVIVDPVIDESSNFISLVLGPKFHPYVNVLFGDISVKTVWDTGASITVVDQQFITENPGFFENIGESLGTDATGSSQRTPSYIMKSCKIGTYVFPPTEVVGVDLSHIKSSTEIPMTMILGYTMLCKADWLFDFPLNRWAITKML